MQYSFNNRGISMPPATKNLIIINLIIFLICQLDRNDVILRNFALLYPTSD